jgi:ribosome recycling factor
LDSLPVKFEGDEYVIQDLAQILRKNPKTIILNMSSFPQAIPAVLESLNSSGMNLNPQQDKTSIFIPIPK